MTGHLCLLHKARDSPELSGTPGQRSDVLPKVSGVGGLSQSSGFMSRCCQYQRGCRKGQHPGWAAVIVQVHLVPSNRKPNCGSAFKGN